MQIENCEARAVASIIIGAGCYDSYGLEGTGASNILRTWINPVLFLKAEAESLETLPIVALAKQCQTVVIELMCCPFFSRPQLVPDYIDNLVYFINIFCKHLGTDAEGFPRVTIRASDFALDISPLLISKLFAPEVSQTFNFKVLKDVSAALTVTVPGTPFTSETQAVEWRPDTNMADVDFFHRVAGRGGSSVVNTMKETRRMVIAGDLPEYVKVLLYTNYSRWDPALIRRSPLMVFISPPRSQVNLCLFGAHFCEIATFENVNTAPGLRRVSAILSQTLGIESREYVEYEQRLSDCVSSGGGLVELANIATQSTSGLIQQLAPVRSCHLNTP
jgi:hypothetical protein